MPVDSCVKLFPERSLWDVVRIDNRRTGYRMTRRLLDAGCKRVAFALGLRF